MTSEDAKPPLPLETIRRYVEILRESGASLRVLKYAEETLVEAEAKAYLPAEASAPPPVCSSCGAQSFGPAAGCECVVEPGPIPAPTADDIRGADRGAHGYVSHAQPPEPLEQHDRGPTIYPNNQPAQPPEPSPEFEKCFAGCGRDGVFQLIARRYCEVHLPVPPPEIKAEPSPDPGHAAKAEWVQEQLHPSRAEPSPEKVESSAAADAIVGMWASDKADAMLLRRNLKVYGEAIRAEERRKIADEIEREADVPVDDCIVNHSLLLTAVRALAWKIRGRDDR